MGLFRITIFLRHKNLQKSIEYEKIHKTIKQDIRSEIVEPTLYGTKIVLIVDVTEITPAIHDIIDADWGDLIEPLPSDYLTLPATADLESEKRKHEDHYNTITTTDENNITARLEAHVMHDGSSSTPGLLQDKIDRYHHYQLKLQACMELLRRQGRDITDEALQACAAKSLESMHGEPEPEQSQQSSEIEA